MCAPRHPRCSSSRRGTSSLLGSTCRRQSEIGPHGHRNEPGFGVLRWIPLYCQGCAQENSVSCRSVAALLQVSSSDPPIACRRGTRPLIRCSARDLSLRAPSGAHYIRPPSAPKGGQRRRKDPHHSRSTGFRLRLSRDRTKTRAEHAESEVLRATVVREVERQRLTSLIHSSSDRAASRAAHRSRGRWCDHALQGRSGDSQAFVFDETILGHWRFSGAHCPTPDAQLPFRSRVHPHRLELSVHPQPRTVHVYTSVRANR